LSEDGKTANVNQLAMRDALALYRTTVVVMIVWKPVGFTMVQLLIGMQAIPSDLYEAAKIDGAGWWSSQLFFTLPLLKRPFALALILSVVGSFLAFDQFFIMTSGGPNRFLVWATRNRS
jgi:ABC-type sugar transport system permease subunit